VNDLYGRRLRKLIEAAGADPVVLLDVAVVLVGAANREACDGRCSEREWVEGLLRLAQVAVDLVGAWTQADALGLLEARLEACEFERVVLDGIWALPEAATDG